MCTVRFVILHVKNLLPVAALPEEERKRRLFFILTVLEQSFSEIRFHVRSVVQSSRICRF